MYTFIVAAGLAIALLLFAQLNNEARAQNKQVRMFFDNLALWVYCPTEKNRAAFALSDDHAQKVHPILSTSTTCGRQQAGEKHQLDLPINTTDKALAGTAAEFTVEPDATSLRLYVRLLEQPYAWVCNEDYSEVVLLVKRLDNYSKKGAPFHAPNDEKQKLPPLPHQLQGKARPSFAIKSGKQLLELGDSVFLGETQITVNYDRRGA